MNETDELDGVRRLLAEPPDPSPEASAKAFGLLTDEMSGGRRVRTTGARRRLRSRWPIGLGAGLVAAGAAAAVVVATVGSPGSPGTGKPSEKIDLNKQAVLAAAAKAALMPTGRYWYTDTVDGQSYIVRAKTGAYAISAASSETFQWTGAKHGSGREFYGRSLPARPLTPRDEALWRRAGSPSSFRVWSNDHYGTYTRRSTPWKADEPETGAGGRWLGDNSVPGKPTGGMTVEDLRNLPTDPERLAARFLRHPSLDANRRDGLRKELAARRQKPVPADPGKRAERAAAIKELQRELAQTEQRLKEDPYGADGTVMDAEELMMDVPFPPAVRAGLMRALAAYPGVRAIGAVVDGLGRKGVALAGPDITIDNGDGDAPGAERGSFVSHQELMFDPRTGELLGGRSVLARPGGAYRSQAPGFVIDYELVRSSGWTDTRPKPPPKLPF
ncbi:hypothetical protein [Actinomadura violacea]|uniref:CU044_5270 family protein n=1 Tax=Actinomadura violacea TaxID=2819934 RepID=A0ABS3SAA1_9ACTN|nr:hypothetical protein [Actinomadura violacea]MBO2465801.1 hypothetical protein [Actinomadura violacea]